MNERRIPISNEIEDFGFSDIDKNPPPTPLEEVKEIVNLIMPLLNNLIKNPEKDTIYWPNRKEKIEKFKSKLLSYVEKK
jgi:hypothetical protein